ncbi:fatty-acid amide hydrolase 2-like isoform X2 [Pseudomyrmex gracilis]|uniref:fatty-acid amide hydrolase 2-like isoform X2 n=1 Tax=Pseudomyrmex gracilis TaxID=219809 RepID=UPI0009956B0F|nr:fatty-acid amide hydrolase 2-like isoform X2 [Pseudomyrmex gracilis]
MMFKLRLLFAVMNVIYLPLEWIVLLIYKKPRCSLTPITKSLFTLSATTIAKKIREKEITSYEVVNEYIERIKEVNSSLNAVVDNRFENAIIEAKKCDEQLRSGKLDLEKLKKEKPLYGVPCTMKESIGVKGCSHTGCTLSRKGVKATDDAVVVKLLRDAGAILLCITNTPEMCICFETTNLVYGHTKNPYDARYSAGGSSGGEGALLGAGASLIGFGSDLGGSIRVPALYNGVFGHKPTSGIVSNTGHYPLSDDKCFQSLLCLGPLARYAEDLSLVMRVITSQCGCNLRLDVPVDVNELKVYYLQSLDRSLGVLPVTAEIKNCVQQAANHFMKYGVSVEKLPIKLPAEICEIALTKIISMENPVSLLNADNTKDPLYELGKGLLGLSENMKETCIMMLAFKHNLFFSKSDISKYAKQGESIRQKLVNLLGENGVFIYPTFHRSAVLPKFSICEIMNHVYTYLFNTFGFPATHVPMGLNRDGLPIGVQVIAAPYQDRLCLAVAKELETAFGGWIPPSPLAIKNN